MKLRTEYLSHEELKAFISEIEQTDMVAAPPDVAEHILSEVTKEVVRLEHEDYYGNTNPEPELASKHKECHENPESDLAVQHKECHENLESDLDLKRKEKEYRNYCFRVWTSVAAAVAMIFLFSKVVSLQPVQEDYVNQYNKKSVFAAFSESNYIFGGEDKWNVFKQMED